jgi:exonuclease VII small subunit
MAKGKNQNDISKQGFEATIKELTAIVDKIEQEQILNNTGCLFFSKRYR